MFSQGVAIGILATIALVLCGIYFAISRKSEGLKKQRKLAFIVIVGVFAGSYFSLLNHVYILGEANVGYEEKILMLPTTITLSNNQQVKVSPKLGVYSVVVNNSKRDAVFETVIYGTASGKPNVYLPAQSVTYVNDSTDYILREPPNSVRIKGSGTTKGWIHY